MELSFRSRFIIACTLPILLIFFGGAVLSYLERPHELETAMQFERLKHDYLESTHEFETNANPPREFLERYIALTKEYTEKHLDNVTGDIRSPHWHLRGAALFCLTLMSTIGYGVYTPQTSLGKLFSCLFTFVAVPSFYFSISTFGQVLKHFLQNIVSNAKALLNSKYNSYIQPHTVSVIFLGVFFLILGGIIFDYTHLKESAVDTLYFNVITLATVGLGDFAPDVNSSSLAMQIGYGVYVWFGLSLLSMLHLAIMDYLDSKNDKAYSAGEDKTFQCTTIRQNNNSLMPSEKEECSKLLAYGATQSDAKQV